MIGRLLDFILFWWVDPEQRAERKRKTEVQEWKEKTFEELDSCFVEMAHLAVAKYRSPFMLLLET